MTAAQWVKYDGSDEQIDEISNTPCGFILRYPTAVQTEIFKRIGSSYVGEYIDSRRRILSGDNLKEVLTKHKITHYLICNPHPLADMIFQQARTGQPVWVKMKSSTYWAIAMRGFDLIYQDHVVSVIKSTTPDWNIPGAEYSFTEFKEEV